MNPFIAPPAILGAMAFRGDSDNYLREGIHLRIFAGMGASMPVTPFFVYKVRGRRSPNNEGASVDLGVHPGQRELSGSIRLHGNTPVRLTFKPAEGDVSAMSLLDSTGTRTIATRAKGPWTFSLPDWRWLSATGSAKRLMADAINAPEDVLDHGMIGERVSRALVLPGEPGGPYAWYVGAEKRAEKERRVGEGVPRIWGPREAQVFSRWSIGQNMALNPLPSVIANPAPTAGKEADEEIARVYKVLTYQTPRIGDVVQTMLTTKEPPWKQMASIEANGAKAEYNPLQMLQLSMCDYGIARHFGYANTWPESTLSLDDDELLAICTIVAFDPTQIPEADEGMVSYTIQRLRQLPTSNQFEKQILRAISEDGLSNDPENELQAIKDAARNLGLMVAPFVTYTSAVEPYDAPRAARPQVVRRHWAEPSGNTPSDKYSAVFAFRNLPMCTLALLERHTGTDFLPRSGAPQDDGADPQYHWLQPSVFGREVESESRRKELNISGAGQMRAAVLTDQSIPAEQTTHFRASASDVFGRFGPPVEFDAQQPDRPGPTAPRLNYVYQRSTPTPTGTGSASPGTLNIKAWFDYTDNAMPPAHGIAVPSVVQSPRGALQIERLEITISGTVQTFEQPGVSNAIGAQATVVLDRTAPSASIAIPGLPPMGQAKLVLTGTYVDAAGKRSPPATAEMTVTDARAPEPLKTGVGLLWTTRPSPAPEVTLDLTWDAPTASEHLVYLGDERTLMQLPGGAARGERGALLCKQASTHDKTKYQRITPTPVKAGAGNKATYTLSLPRTLESIQVVRVVPLGPDGAEPPFENCTTVPVAVPSSRRAAPPLLVGQVDATTGKATLKIIADGLNLDELRREQPGLFDQNKLGKQSPRARIRRSSGKVSHPMYAQVQAPPGGQGDAEGSFALELKSETVGGETRYWFEAEVDGTELVPYVRYVYWAEVRLPPERCVPADTTQVASGISSVHPESAQPAERLWGELSSALVLMHAPAIEPIEEADVSVQIVDTTPPRTKIRIALAATPVRSVKLVGPYRLATWYRWGDGAIGPTLDSAGNPTDKAWPEVWNVPELYVEPAPTAASQLNVHVALMDPVGRLGPVTVIHA